MKIFNPLYNQIPKVELHCHLEGSIRTSTILDNARRFNLDLPTTDPFALDRIIKVREQMKDLQSVLNAFRIFQDSLASIESVGRITYELCEDAARQNIRLLEIRFSPDWAFSGHLLDWDQALEAILQAQASARADFGLVSGLIAISSRGLGVASCEKTVDWAIRQKGSILGIDLADDEQRHPIREFLRPVLRAKDAGLKVTVHTGEDTSAATVVETILAVHPQRIGHGIHISEDPAAMDLVKKEGITLEVNPWSNYLTNAVPEIGMHPLKFLYDQGVRVTINSDDPEVLDTNLNHEYQIAHELLGMSLEDIDRCNRIALDSSFLPEAQKDLVRQAVSQWR